jgi:hypothetical protein
VTRVQDHWEKHSRHADIMQRVMLNRLMMKSGPTGNERDCHTNEAGRGRQTDSLTA